MVKLAILYSEDVVNNAMAMKTSAVWSQIFETARRRQLEPWFLGQRPRQFGAAVGVVPPEQGRARDEHDLSADAREELRRLEAYRSAAQHQEPRWRIGEAHHVVAGEQRDPVDTR